MSAALVLKVDVDTYHGTLEGIPRLLDLFAKESIRATFFFSLGPDTSGKAIKRVFRKGFIRKVLSASPAASYGLRTMLYGTLLPAPDIGKSPDAIARMREVKAAGHECGIHAWDHIDWHDRLPRMNRPEVERVVACCHQRFREVFGEPATLSAAPGWTATALSMEVQEAAGIRVTSDSRGGAPFHPLRLDGSASAILEVPSTLPTLDELLAWPEYRKNHDAVVPHLVDAVRQSPGIAVHSLHTEIEGGKAFVDLFRRQLRAWKDAGVPFLPLGAAAASALSSGIEIPAAALTWSTLPGRSTPVASHAA